jgi:HEPN domain-containing protein
MNCGKTTPWEQYPKNLHFHEIQNPTKVIIDFFSAAWPKDQRTDLKQWRNYVICDQHYHDERHGPGTLLFIYELNVKLVEAMHLLLLAYKGNFCKAKEITNLQLESEKRAWVYFPKNLSGKELLDPYQAVNKCFKKIKPQAYRDYLHDWLHAALYNRSADEWMTASEVITVYENMLRLYSAAWLIHQRDTDKTITHKGWGKANEQRRMNDKAEQPIQLKQFGSAMAVAGESGLEEVKKLIVERLPSVSLIVYLGKHEDPFTYYLLVLIDDGEKTPEHEISNKIEDNCRQLVNVYAIAHKAGGAIAGIQNGQRFWNSAFSKGKIIYQAPELELPEVKDISKDALLKRADFHWRRWGLQGNEFLKGAEWYAVKGNYKLAAFLLHQSVESILKSVIQVILGYRVQIHNLSRLLRLTLLFTDAFKDVFKLDTTEGCQIFTLLQSSYSQSRYKNEFDPEKESIQILIEQVTMLFGTAEVVYKQYIDKL